MDVLLSLTALILLSPVFLIVCLLVRRFLGSPIFFKQERVGLNEKVFVIYKFRTMTNERNASGELIPDQLRLTKFGRWLRSTSLDELPELFNILKGDMSVVGPRPLLVRYLPLYNERQKRRHEVRPGLTGLAQINGRNTIGWDERLELDVRYVDGISFVNDFKIILRTFVKVFTREGINQSGDVTMEDFKGSNIIEKESKGSE